MKQKIASSCSQVHEILDSFCRQQESLLVRLGHQLGELFAGGGQLLIAGNAGFQPIVQLLAGHFTYRLSFDRPTLPAIALGSDPILSAAMRNAGQQDQHLVRHYRALNSEHHMLLLFSDGSASTALKALRDEVLANDRPVALLTANSETDPLCHDGVEICLNIGSEQVTRQLEVALFAGQLLCELVESELFGV